MTELGDPLGPIGQDRAVEAVDFAVQMRRKGYNIYALGPSGTGKHTIIADLLRGQAESAPTPSDWCYVNNFTDPQKPHRLQLPSGRAASLREAMRRLVEEKGASEARVTIVHNWADAETIAPAPKDNAFSRAQGLADRFVVMHSGNVGLSQNLDLVLEAADRLRSHANIVFAIVGNGARRQALEAGAKQRGLANVRFLSYQPKDHLSESFAAADTARVETALWTALRALEERAGLHRRMSARAEARGQVIRAAGYDRSAAETVRHALVVRELLASFVGTADEDVA